MSSNVLISPTGLIVGSLNSSADGRTAPDKQRHCIVLLDGWLHHMAQNVGLEGVNNFQEHVKDPWVRMHPKESAGLAEADFPAPLVTAKRKGNFGQPGYDILVVKEKISRRYFYDHAAWSANCELPASFATEGAPALLRCDEMFPFGVHRRHAFVPEAIGLRKYAYAQKFNFWWPDGEILDNVENSWPCVIRHKHYYMLFIVIRQDLRIFMKFVDIPIPIPYFQQWFEAPWWRPKVECSGPPSVVFTRPRIDYRRGLPTIRPGVAHLVVPTGSAMRLMHLRAEIGAFDWSYNDTGFKSSSGVSLLETPPRAGESWTDHADVQMLFPRDRDMFETYYSSRDQTWSEPRPAF
jgi:hypothetical protein